MIPDTPSSAASGMGEYELASASVRPEPGSVSDTIRADDLKIDVWPYGKSPGGQQCGTHPGVRVTHLPTNTAATVECAGSQFRNKEIALEMILAAITHPRFRS